MRARKGWERLATRPISSNTTGELRALLGPLVSPLLRSSDGSLDRAKLPEGSLEDFRQFLLTQVKLDGLVFNEYLLDSYHKVLGKEKYRPLLEELFEDGRKKNGETQAGPGEEKNQELLKEFTAEIIHVSSQNFVTAHIDHEEGRQRLHAALIDSDHFSMDVRSDLAKAIAQVGYQRGGSSSTFQRFNQNISVMDYWNLTVGKSNLEGAALVADEVLEEMGRYESQVRSLEKKYLETPEQVERYRGLEKKITYEQIRKHAQQATANSSDLNPVSQLKGKLARFWLMVADEGHWKESNAYKTTVNGAFLLRRTEELLKQGEGVKNEGEFLIWTEAVRDFLHGGLHVEGTGWKRGVADFIAPSTVADMTKSIPQAHRVAFDDLRQFLDEIHHAHDMGESISIPPVGKKNQEPLDEVKGQFILGLQQAKRSLWYNYKQHRTLSRVGSWTADIFGAGDIAEIKVGQKALDQLIKKVEAAQDGSALGSVVKELQGQLKEKGELQMAMRAAEMEGIEQLIGLVQSIMILMASRGLIGGAKWLGRLVSPAPAASTAVQVVEAGTAEVAATTPSGMGVVVREGGTRMAKAFALGAYQSAAENAVAVVSGEVRQGKEHWKNWLKDSASTGLSMMLLAGPFPLLGESAAGSSIGKAIKLRYGSGGIKIAGRLGYDTVSEIPQEWLDAYFRAQMDDFGNGVVGYDQARELGLVSAFGGAHMGTARELIKGTSHAKAPKVDSNQEDSGPSIESERTPPSIGPFEQIQNLAQAYGQKPVLFPFSHPARVRSVLESSLKESLLGPLQNMDKNSATYLWQSPLRQSAHAFLGKGIQILYPIYWTLTRPFTFLRSSEEKTNEKIRADLARRRELFESNAPEKPELHEVAQLTERADRPKTSDQTFNAVLHWSDYQEIAKIRGWDPYLVLARGLKEARWPEIEMVLEDTFGNNLDKKADFLIQYPIRNGYPILSSDAGIHDISNQPHLVRSPLGFSASVPSKESHLHYLDLAQALAAMGRKSLTNWDMANQPGLHPQAMMHRVTNLGIAVAMDEEIYRRSLELTLKFLQDRMAPEEIIVPGMDLFERPALKAAVIRLWGHAKRKEFLPEILACLKNVKDPQVLRAAAWTLAHWRAKEAVGSLGQLAKNGRSPLVRIAAQRALGVIEDDDPHTELRDWLSAPVLGSFHQGNESLWEQMGGEPISTMLKLPPSQGKAELISRNKQRLEFAEALLTISEDYLDRGLKRSDLTEYQIVASRMLIDILLEGNSSLQKRALEILSKVPENPLKRFLDASRKQDWDKPSEKKFRDIKDLMFTYLRDSKNPLESRVRLLGLFQNELWDEEVQGIEDELLSNPNTASAAAQLFDDELRNWDKHIQDERQRLMTPPANARPVNGGKPPSEGGPAFEGFTAMIGGMAMAGVQSPWAYGAGILFCLGMAHMVNRGPRRQFLRDKILKNSKSFYRKINKETVARVQKMYQEMAADPAFQDSYLFRQLETVARWIDQGVDPEFIFHNTGGTAQRFGDMLAGKGSGEFPVTINTLMGFRPEYFSQTLDLYALRRGSPYHSLVVTLPASKILEWMQNHRETFAQKVLIGEQILATLMPSLVRLAQEHGSAKILALPTHDPFAKREREYLLASLKVGGIDQKIFMEAKGPFFEEAMVSTDAERKKATQRWAKPLVGKLEVQQREYLKAWIDLVLDYAKDENPIAFAERGTLEILEEVARKEGLLLPQTQIINHIIRAVAPDIAELAEKVRKNLEKKLPKGQFPLSALFKVVSTWKKERSLPEGMVYHAFGETLNVAMEPWWARMLNQGKDKDLSIHEVLHYLFGLSKDTLRPIYELQWISQYHIKQGLPVAYQYLSHHDYKVRIHAMQTLMDLDTPALPEDLMGRLYHFVGLPDLSREETMEISMILKALRTFKVLPERGSLLKYYLLALMDSRLDRRTFNISSDLNYPFSESTNFRPIDMYLYANRQAIASEAEATYHYLGYSSGKPYLDGELNQKNAERRQKALEIIQTANLETYLPQVEGMRRDPDAFNRMLVADILAKFGGSEMVPLLGEFLTHDPDPQVQAHAAEVLLRKKDTTSTDLVHFVLQTRWDQIEGRMHLLYLLGLLKDKSALHLFKTALESEIPQERLLAAASLARIGKFDLAKETFIECLKGKDLSMKHFILKELLTMEEAEGKTFYHMIREADPEIFTNLLKEKIPEVFRLLDRFEKGWDLVRQANWQWLRTELKNGALISPEIKDVPWRRFLKKALRQNQSDLGEYYKLQYQEVLEQAARSAFSKEETRVHLMTTLQGDFYDRLQEFGGRPESLDFREIMQKRLKAGGPVPDWVRAWLGVHPENRVPMASLTFTPEQFEKLFDLKTTDVALSNSVELYHTLGEEIALLLGLPKDFLVQEDDDTIRYNFLPLRLLLTSLETMHGKNAVQPEETSDGSTLWEIVRMVKEHKRPLLFSQINREIEGSFKVVPFVAALHDWYHLLTFSQLSEPIQSGTFALIEVMEEMDLIKEDNEGLRLILSGLINEQDPGFGEIFAKMKNEQLKDPMAVETFYQKLKEKIHDHPNHQLILDKFEKTFRESMEEWDTLPPSR